MTRPPLLILLPALFLLQAIGLALYLGQETGPHFWDYAMYANMALAWFSLHGAQAWGVFQQSFDNNYNYLFAVPSRLAFALFGPDRTVFILTNLFVYAIPQQLLYGAILRRVFGLAWGRAFLLGVLLSLLMPFAWYALLEGYPDSSSASCLAAGFLLLLNKDRGWKRGLGMGVLLAFAIIFRRHHAYAAVALLLAGASGDLAMAWLETRGRGLWPRLWRLSLFYGLAALLVPTLLYLIEPVYLQTMLQTNFNVLYQSYDRGFEFFAQFLAGKMGLGLLGLVICGFALGVQKLPAARWGLSLAMGWGVFWLFLWGAGPGQAGDHYLTSVPPVLVLLGLAALGVLLKKRKAAFNLVFGLLALNSLYCFVLAEHPLPSERPAIALWGSPRPPWVRKDFEELKKLADYVRMTTPTGRIVVVGSSFILNQDLIRAVYTDVLKDVPTAMRFLPAPEIDHEQGPPLDAYAGASTYLVPVPMQYHLDPEGQKVVTAFAKIFDLPEEARAHYTKDQREFFLDGGVTVQVWRRRPMTFDVLHKELGRIRAVSTSGQTWVQTTWAMGALITEEKGGLSSLVLQTIPRFDEAVFFYDRSLPVGSYRLRGQYAMSEGCQNTTFTIKTWGKGPEALTATHHIAFPSGGLLSAPFSLHKEGFVTLGVETTPLENCRLSLSGLGLEQM